MPPKTNIVATPAALELERANLLAAHEAKIAELNERKAALAALRQPVTDLLAQRAELLAKLTHATARRTFRPAFTP